MLVDFWAEAAHPVAMATTETITTDRSNMVNMMGNMLSIGKKTTVLNLLLVDASLTSLQPVRSTYNVSEKRFFIPKNV